ncbi:hypothetical protein SprV_0100328800 [Sparganum proliferum]
MSIAYAPVDQIAWIDINSQYPSKLLRFGSLVFRFTVTRLNVPAERLYATKLVMGRLIVFGDSLDILTLLKTRFIPTNTSRLGVVNTMKANVSRVLARIWIVRLADLTFPPSTCLPYRINLNGLYSHLTTSAAS